MCNLRIVKNCYSAIIKDVKRGHKELQAHPYRKVFIMKYYVISYENGETRYGEFADYTSALNYAESRNGGYEFTIEEYDSENDYFC